MKDIFDIDYTNLCYYDLRNPQGIGEYKDDPEVYGYDEEDFKSLGNHAKDNCACDSCYYGNAKLTEQLIKMKEYYKKLSKEEIKEIRKCIE